MTAKITQIAIAATAIAAVAGFLVDTAEARGFSGGGRSFSRPSISRPVFNRSAAFKPIKAPRIVSPVKAPKLGPVAGHRPIKNPPKLGPIAGHNPKPPIKLPGGIKNPPKLGPIAGHDPKPPIKVPGGIKLPPKLGPIAGNPGIKLPPNFPGRPVDPGFPPGGNIKNPPQGPIGNPGNPGNGYLPTPPGLDGIGGGGASVDVTISVGGEGEAQASATPVCEAFYVKWQETGSKAWKLAYYECTGDL